MPPLHPPCSGMPLAFIAFLVVVELLSLIRRWRDSLVSTRLIAVCALAASVTLSFLSGYQASSSLGDLSLDTEAALSEHHAYGRLLIINAGVMLVFFLVAGRAVHAKRTMWGLYYTTMILQIILTLLVGNMGGDLVFNHAVGVKQIHQSNATQ